VIALPWLSRMAALRAENEQLKAERQTVMLQLTRAEREAAALREALFPATLINRARVVDHPPTAVRNTFPVWGER